MFQSVIEQHEWRARRLGTGAGVSLLVHAGLLAAALLLSTGPAREVKKEPREVVFRIPPPRGTNIPPATQPAVAEPPKPRREKRRDPLQPPTIPTTPPPEAEPAPEPQAPPEDLPYHPDARPDGIGEALPCVTCLVDPHATVAPVEPTAEEVLPFVSGNMTAPRLLSGAPLQYTREALESRVEGLLIARCVITREGAVEDCRILKGQPHMNEAVVSALETRRYTPVHYRGRPTSVIYNFHVQLKLPR